jgi:hypothetical protein
LGFAVGSARHFAADADRVKLRVEVVSGARCNTNVAIGPKRLRQGGPGYRGIFRNELAFELPTGDTPDQLGNTIGRVALAQIDSGVCAEQQGCVGLSWATRQLYWNDGPLIVSRHYKRRFHLFLVR